MRWTAEQDDFLREYIPGHGEKECMEAFRERFGVEITKNQLSNRRQKLGVRHGTRKMPAKYWTPEKLAFMAEIIPGHEEHEIKALFLERFGDELNSGQIGNVKTRLHITSGTRGGRFKPGQPAFNKGKKWADFMSPEGMEGSRRTQFKKGELHDRTDGWIKPIGFERLSKDGYIEVKVRDGLQEKPCKNYRPKHRIIWEQHHGPIPEGVNIVFADGDRTNFDPENLVAVPRGCWGPMMKRGAEYKDRETLETQVRITELSRAIRAAEKKRKENL